MSNSKVYVKLKLQVQHINEGQNSVSRNLKGLGKLGEFDFQEKFIEFRYGFNP